MRVLYITTIGITMRFFESFIKSQLDIGNQIDIATNENNGKDAVPNCYREWGCHVYHIDTSRSAVSMGNIRAIKQIRDIVIDNCYDIVHCHTPLAAVVTRIACKNLRRKGVKVIYTAHGFHFFRGAPLKNWLLFYPIERGLSWFTDTLITINIEDYQRAKKSFHAINIVYVPGVGVDNHIYTDEGCSLTIKKNLRERILPICCSLDNIVLLSVGELNDNKNHHVVIETLGKINNPNIYYFIAGVGEQKELLENLIEKQGLSKQIHLLGYRDDIDDLMRLSDVYVLPSKREGLNVSLMEAMSSGLPCVVSNIRGNSDLIEMDKGGYLIEPNDNEGWENAIKKMCSLPDKRERFGKNNKLKIKNFSKEKVQKMMTDIYSKTLSADNVL